MNFTVCSRVDRPAHEAVVVGARFETKQEHTLPEVLEKGQAHPIGTSGFSRSVHGFVRPDTVMEKADE
jgi:hypothetical protein